MCLRILTALVQSNEVAWVAAVQAGVLYTLTVLLPIDSTDDIADSSAAKNLVAARQQVLLIRQHSASLLSRLLKHPLHGARIQIAMKKLLPTGLVAAIAEDPGEVAVALLDEQCETPDRVWTAAMYRETAVEVGRLADAARTAQVQGSPDQILPEDYAIRHAALERELVVGGVYVRLFMKDPRYPLRDPGGFCEQLVAEFMRSAYAASNSDSLQRALTLSAATVMLLQVQTGLSEAIVKLGYIPKLLALLTSILAADPNDPDAPAASL